MITGPVKLANSLPVTWLATGCLIIVEDRILPNGLVDPRGDFDIYYAVAHPGLAITLPAMFGLFAIIYLALSRAPKIRVRIALAGAHWLTSAVGALLIEAPVLAMSWIAPSRYEDPFKAFKAWIQVAAVGYGLLLASVLLFLYLIADGIWAARRRHPMPKGG